MTGALSGIKVVEVSVAMAAPFCGMMLADQGADVVKVERVGRGDDSRAWPPHFHGSMSHYFAAANRNKRSVAVDLKSPDGVEIVRRLAVDADVLIENYRVGALERAGLGFGELSRANPRLVYCSISGFGREGARREERANDLFMQAFSGSMSVTGHRGSGPVKMGPSIADIGAGLFASIGVLSALEARHRTGRGQHVDTSLLDGQLAILSYHLTSFFASGVVPGPQGSGAEFGVPYQAFPTGDDWLIIAVFNETMWQALCVGIGRKEWADDPRFSDLPTRIRHRDVLIEMLSEVLRTMPASHWETSLKASGIPCTRVNRIDQIVDDPQVRAMGMIADLDVDRLGPIRMAAPPIRFSDTPSSVHLPPPRLGQHTRDVVRSVGFSDDHIDRLAAGGVLGLDDFDATDSTTGQDL
ncbi:MAG: acyl-CoA transferase [Acidimicrobiaceae bacterium]|nr:MAG: acyl-CoA transferase [Acidimicrobiaceae bacterium]